MRDDPLPDPTDVFDVAVIGGGVVGCAILRRLALDGCRAILIEKAADLLDGASKGNSAILHTGFDAPEGSLEARLVAEGHAEYLEIHGRLGLPLIRSGALVAAWTEAEAARLPGLMAQAAANAVTDVEPLSGEAIRRLEPALAPGVVAGFRVPREYLIDPWSAPHAYASQAVANGARVLRGAPVTGAERTGRGWRLDTPRGGVRARVVVNAAGLWGDHVERLLTGTASFAVRPRKGQFIVYDKPAAALLGHILLPVPSEATKGVVVCRTAFGNLLVGPTAEEQDDRTAAALDAATLATLRVRGEALVPALEGHAVTAIYAGLRPATERKEYRIRVEAGLGYVGVNGIRSTGLSAALGLARHVAGHVAGLIDGIADGLAARPAPLADPVWPRAPMLAEGEARDWMRPGHGGIVCHCEMVTAREIDAALDGPLGARSLAGLKRRTRATLGRCQGFYCSAALARMTHGRLAEPMVAGDG